MTAAAGTGRPGGTTRARRKTILLAGLAIALGAMVFILANVHLVYVAVTSQPECVAHLKAPGDAPGAFRAAKPAC